MPLYCTLDISTYVHNRYARSACDSVLVIIIPSWAQLCNGLRMHTACAYIFMSLYDIIHDRWYINYYGYTQDLRTIPVSNLFLPAMPIITRRLIVPVVLFGNGRYRNNFLLFLTGLLVLCRNIYSFHVLRESNFLRYCAFCNGIVFETLFQRLTYIVFGTMFWNEFTRGSMVIILVSVTLPKPINFTPHLIQVVRGKSLL